MADPRSTRGRILKNLERQLETITVANGYSIGVVNVTTSVKNWHDTPAAETPVIYIIDEETSPKYHAGRLIEWEWDISLFVVMRDKTQLEMEEHVSDIIECVGKNRTLAFTDSNPGPSSSIIVKRIVTDNQLFSEIEGSQLFKITLVVKYTGCLDSPR
jgi:hypothetical protein